MNLSGSPIENIGIYSDAPPDALTATGDMDALKTQIASLDREWKFRTQEKYHLRFLVRTCFDWR